MILPCHRNRILFLFPFSEEHCLRFFGENFHRFIMESFGLNYRVSDSFACFSMFFCRHNVYEAFCARLQIRLDVLHVQLGLLCQDSLYLFAMVLCLPEEQLLVKVGLVADQNFSFCCGFINVIFILEATSFCFLHDFLVFGRSVFAKQLTPL